MVNGQVNKRPTKSRGDLTAKGGTIMAKKKNGGAVAEKTAEIKAAGKATSAQEERKAFVEKCGKRIAEAFASFPKGKATSAGTWKKAFPKAEVPQRLVDYALYVLGLRKTTDKGLIRWAEEDKPKANGKTKA